MALASLPFGSRDPFWPAIWTFPLAVCLLIGLRLRFARHETWLIGLLLAGCTALAAVLLLQQGVGGLPPHPAWARTSRVLGEQLAGLPRVGAAFPLQDVVLMQLPVLALIGGLCLSRVVTRTRDVLTVVVLAGAGYALIWMVMKFVSPEFILWRAKTGHIANLTGTFTNRNAAAAFLAVPLVCGVLLVADLAERTFLRANSDARIVASALFRRMPARLVILCLATGLIAAALLLTSSRAGIILAVVMGLVAAGLRMRRRLRRLGKAWGMALATAAMLLAVMTLFGESLQQRFVDSQEVDIDRWESYVAMLGIIRENALIGIGFGHFADIFPLYRPAAISPRGVWEAAHNTYLQILIEGGVISFVAVLVPLAYVVGTLLHSIVRGRADRLAPIAGLCVLLMPVLHAMVDFQAQTPGYALPLLILVGLLVARCRNGRTAPVLSKARDMAT
jgi:O-antigen ligase